VTSILRGTFVRLDYTWSYQGAPQEGSLLIGLDPKSKELSGHWIDTFHMGRKVLTCLGVDQPDGAIALKGSYAAPPGPDWGWRIEITPGPGSLKIEHFNIDGEGHEDPAVEADYVRA
jgi:hypothetical protein